MVLIIRKLNTNTIPIDTAVCPQNTFSIQFKNLYTF